MIFKKSNAVANQNIESTQIDSLIGSNLTVTGDLRFSGGLRVDGKIVGDVTGIDEKSLLVSSKESKIDGNVESYDAVINGTIVGDLTVLHFLQLQGNAVIKGNISYAQLQMECGVVVDGNLKKINAEEIKSLPNPVNKQEKLNSSKKSHKEISKESENPAS